MQVGLPLDRAHPEQSCRHAFPPSGPRPAFLHGAALQFDKGVNGRDWAIDRATVIFQWCFMYQSSFSEAC